MPSLDKDKYSNILKLELRFIIFQGESEDFHLGLAIDIVIDIKRQSKVQRIMRRSQLTHSPIKTCDNQLRLITVIYL